MGAEQPPYADQADEWLVERCREAVDEAAFAELVRRYRGPVFRLAVSILGQEFVPEAEDVAQDVMVRMHRALGSFRGDAKFGSWIYRIGFNHALNVKARVRYRAPHVSDESLSTTPSADRSPEDQLQDDRRKRAVHECIAELPEVYQSALRSFPPPSRHENGRAEEILQTADERRDGAPHAGQQDFEIACG